MGRHEEKKTPRAKKPKRNVAKAIIRPRSRPSGSRGRLNGRRGFAVRPVGGSTAPRPGNAAQNDASAQRPAPPSPEREEASTRGEVESVCLGRRRATRAKQKKKREEGLMQPVRIKVCDQPVIPYSCNTGRSIKPARFDHRPSRLSFFRALASTTTPKQKKTIDEGLSTS